MEKLVIEEVIPLGSSEDNGIGPRVPLPGTGDSAGEDDTSIFVIDF
jgi:hypothetical protein